MCDIDLDDIDEEEGFLFETDGVTTRCNHSPLYSACMDLYNRLKAIEDEEE